VRSKDRVRQGQGRSRNLSGHRIKKKLLLCIGGQVLKRPLTIDEEVRNKRKKNRLDFLAANDALVNSNKPPGNKRRRKDKQSHESLLERGCGGEGGRKGREEGNKVGKHSSYEKKFDAEGQLRIKGP